MISLRPSLSWGWPLLLCAIAPAIRAQSTSDSPPAGEPVQLDAVVVSATRTAQSEALVPTSVTALPLSQMANSQVFDLRTALSEVPGVDVVETGAAGSQTSLFIRGANSDETLFFVDGVPMNDRSANYSNFLGGASLAGLDRVEVLRGPQSTLYGSAGGGVIFVDTAHGSGPATGTASVEGGSFSSLAASASEEGSQGPVSYSASVGRSTTANERPDDHFQAWTSSARLEDAPAPWALVGATVRTQETTGEEPSMIYSVGADGNDYVSPGILSFPDPGHIASQNNLVTAYGQVQADGFTSRITGALHRRQYEFTDSSGTSQTDNDRRIGEWQTTWSRSRVLEVVAGAETEASEYLIDGAETSDELAAGFLSATVRPVSTVEIVAGLRRDDYRSVGGDTTGRVGAAWEPVRSTTVRANWGTGFTAPGSDDRYGVAEFQELPNPNLKPERSRGGDAGVEERLDACRLTLDADLFWRRTADEFSYAYVDAYYDGEVVNLQRATSKGAETAVAAGPWAGVTGKLAYTYLDASDDTDNTRLVRRPRHEASADLEWAPARGWILGAGASAVGGRLDTGYDANFDPLSVAMPNYIVARAYGSWQVTSRLRLRIRLENALNHAYQEVLGYPALPRGWFAGADWTF